MQNLAVPIEGPGPVDGILRELLDGANPGFDGELSFTICISVTAERREASFHVAKPMPPGDSHPDAERIQKVKSVAENVASLLRYRQGSYTVVGNFKDGHIGSYRLIDREE